MTRAVSAGLMAGVPEITFSKYHGLGNDFVLLDARGTGRLLTPRQAAALCERHRGIGADGVLTLLPSRRPEAQLRMHLYNADGSTAEMCGNGLRCVVRAAFGGVGRETLMVDTDAGLRRGEISGAGVRVELGTPRLGPAPVVAEAAGVRYEGLSISMGNPHFVLRPFEAGTDLWSLAGRIGPELERWRDFPQRTNVELLAPEGDALRVVVFERGVGLTQACGTGAGAAFVAARAQGLAGDAARVRLPGGELLVELGRGPEGGEQVWITGEAVLVFEGRLELPEDAPGQRS